MLAPSMLQCCAYAWPTRAALAVRNTAAPEGRWVPWRREGDERIAAYNPHLLLRVKRHCNFLVSAGTASIGYLLNYPLKGDC